MKFKKRKMVLSRPQFVKELEKNRELKTKKEKSTTIKFSASIDAGLFHGTR